MHSTLKTPSKHQQNLTHTFEFVENLLIDTLKKKKKMIGAVYHEPQGREEFNHNKDQKKR